MCELVVSKVSRVKVYGMRSTTRYRALTACRLTYILLQQPPINACHKEYAEKGSPSSTITVKLNGGLSITSVV